MHSFKKFPWILLWLLPAVHQSCEGSWASEGFFVGRVVMGVGRIFSAHTPSDAHVFHTHYPWPVTKNKNRGSSALLNVVSTPRYSCCWSVSHDVALLTRLGSHLMTEGWPHVSGTIFQLHLSLCVVPVMPKSSSELPNSAPYSQFEVSHFRLRTNMSWWCNLSRLLPTLCSLLSVMTSL